MQIRSDRMHMTVRCWGTTHMETNIFMTCMPFVSSSLACGPFSLIIAFFRRVAYTYLSYAFFHNLLTPINFKSFSTQSNHLNFGLPGILLHPVSSEIPSFSSCHQTFLPDDQPILLFVLLLLLQYLVFLT